MVLLCDTLVCKFENENDCDIVNSRIGLLVTYLTKIFDSEISFMTPRLHLLVILKRENAIKCKYAATKVLM